jgi:hypothetical protein
MPRTIRLAFVCLLCLGALGALRASTGARTIEAHTDAAQPPAIEAGLPLAKSDKLPSLPLDRAEAKAGVATVKIAPETPEKASLRTIEARPAATEQVTSWHWHAGSKIIKRTISQPKSDRDR